MTRMAGLVAAATVWAALAATPASAQWFHVDDGYGGVAYGGTVRRPTRAIDSYTVHYGRGRSERLVIYEDGFTFERQGTRGARKAKGKAGRPVPAKMGASAEPAQAEPVQPAQSAAPASPTRLEPVGQPGRASAAPEPAKPAKPLVTAAKPAVERTEPRAVRVIEGVTPVPARRSTTDSAEFAISQ